VGSNGVGVACVVELTVRSPRRWGVVVHEAGPAHGGHKIPHKGLALVSGVFLPGKVKVEVTCHNDSLKYCMPFQSDRTVIPAETFPLPESSTVGTQMRGVQPREGGRGHHHAPRVHGGGPAQMETPHW
jgi:hypothetical protein